MKIIGLLKLQKFSRKHSDANASIAVFIKAASHAQWTKPIDVLQTFSKAKLLKNNRARFEIAGSKYRLVIEVYFDDELIEIRFIGPHSDFDNIDPETI